MIGLLLKNRFVHYVILAAIIFFLWKAWQKEIKEVRRVTNNNEVLRAEQDSAQAKIKAYQATSDEFKEYYLAKEDSLLKELKIKPKEILSIQYIKTSDKDTIEVPIYTDTIFNDSTKWMVHKSYTKIGCSIVSFTWNNVEPTGTFNYDLRTDIQIIEHTERRKLLGKKWLPRWGRKEVFITLVDNCSDSTILENKKIDIIDRKEKLWRKRK